MTTTKLPPDMVLATPIGGKDIDPELEAKLKDKKTNTKGTDFKFLSHKGSKMLSSASNKSKTAAIAATTFTQRMKLKRSSSI